MSAKRILSTVMVVTALSLCGCGSKSMDKTTFVTSVFGSSFPTNLQVKHFFKSGVGGSAAVARVDGKSEEIRLALSQQGFKESPVDESNNSLELLQLRVRSISTEAAANLLPTNYENAKYMIQSQDSPKELREFYVLTNYTQFFFIVIRR